MLNLTVAPPGRFMEMSLVNAQIHKHIHMYVCRHIVWQTHQDRHHMQQEIHLHNFCVWPFRILCAWLGIILLISEWARWTGGARRQAHGQAVWIISLSRIQLYNELNLFCAALRRLPRSNKDSGASSLFHRSDDVHHHHANCIILVNVALFPSCFFLLSLAAFGDMEGYAIAIVFCPPLSFFSGQWFIFTQLLLGKVAPRTRLRTSWGLTFLTL